MDRTPPFARLFHSLLLVPILFGIISCSASEHSLQGGAKEGRGDKRLGLSSDSIAATRGEERQSVQHEGERATTVSDQRIASGEPVLGDVRERRDQEPNAQDLPAPEVVDEPKPSPQCPQGLGDLTPPSTKPRTFGGIGYTTHFVNQCRPGNLGDLHALPAYCREPDVLNGKFLREMYRYWVDKCAARARRMCAQAENAGVEIFYYDPKTFDLCIEEKFQKQGLEKKEQSCIIALGDLCRPYWVGTGTIEDTTR